MSDPVNIVKPVISGTPNVGSVLSCSTGSWTNSPTRFAYQWESVAAVLIGGVWVPSGPFVDIAGEVNANHLCTNADIGMFLDCEVTASQDVTPPPPGTWPPTRGEHLFGDAWTASPAGGDAANSAAIVSALVAANTGGAELSLGKFGVAFYVVSDATPRRNVLFTDGSCQGTYSGGRTPPIAIPIPNGAQPALGSDGHMSCVSQPGCAWDFWKAIRGSDTAWTTCATNSLDLSTAPSGSYPDGFGCRGSSFSNLAGCLWPDEILSGVINHCLGLILPSACVKNTYVDPSTDSDGAQTGTNKIPEGAKLVLTCSDAAINALSGYQKIVARCLKDYGGIVIDKTGSDVSIPCVAPQSWTSQGLANPWAAIPGMNTDYPTLSGVAALFNTFRVAAWAGGETVAGGQSLVPSGCT